MECGECTVCCTLSVVPELGKSAGITCIHCFDNKCNIYGEHPKSCKEFECAWLQGDNSIELRPDNCGTMFVKKNEHIFSGIVVPGTQVTETAKGQIESFLSQGYSVVMLKLGERPFVIPANGRSKIEVFKEYVDLLKRGNLQH